MCNNQIIATIYEMMKFNKVSLEQLIEFIDNQKKSYKSYSYDKTKKWGDEAVELDYIESQQTAEEQVVEEQVAEEQVTEEQVVEEKLLKKKLLKKKLLKNRLLKNKKIKLLGFP